MVGACPAGVSICGEEGTVAHEPRPRSTAECVKGPRHAAECGSRLYTFVLFSTLKTVLLLL